MGCVCWGKREREREGAVGEVSCSRFVDLGLLVLQGLAPVPPDLGLVLEGCPLDLEHR